MKDLKNVPKAQNILASISRYQQLLNKPTDMWTSISIQVPKSTDVMICAGNIGTEEMVKCQEAVLAAIRLRIDALNAELETL